MAYQPKSYRKFVATAATATLVASAVTPAFAAPTQGASENFTDVPARYKEAVDYLVGQKITIGETPTKFGTQNNIKRVDVAVMVARATLPAETIENAPLSSFTDVPDRARLYVDALKAAGFVNGKSDTQFDSAASITRGEAALLLTKAYKLETKGEKQTTFTDVSERYAEAVEALVDNGIANGKTTTRFGTADPITRGELALLLHKLETLPPIGDGDGEEVTEEGIKLTAAKSTLTANGADNTVITAQILDENGQVDKDADNLVLAFNSTYGSLANTRVTVQDGVATVVLTSEFSKKEIESIVTARLIEAAEGTKWSNQIGNLYAEAKVKFSPVTDSIGAKPPVVTAAESNSAERVTVFFDQEVNPSTFLQMDGNTFLTDIDGNVLFRNDAQVSIAQPGDAPAKIRGVKSVPGNVKALEFVLTKTDALTDNKEVNVAASFVKNGETTQSQKSFILTDARTPELTSVEVVDGKTVDLVFSEPVDSIQDVQIDGGSVAIEQPQYGEFEQNTTDRRHIVRVKATNFFKSGTHSVQVTKVKDYAGEVSSNQTLDFVIVANNTIPAATIEVESPEQLRVKFNTPVSALNLASLDFQVKDADGNWVSSTNFAAFKRPVAWTATPVGTDNKEFVLELKEDWTQIFDTKNTNENYYNYDYRVVIAEGAVTNEVNGKKNEKQTLDLGGALDTPDNTSPALVGTPTLITTGVDKDNWYVSFTEPVKVPGKDVSTVPNGVVLDTPSQLQNGSIPEVVVEFIGTDKDGKKVTVPGTVVRYYDDVKKDTQLLVKPNQVLQGLVDQSAYEENWQLVIRNVTDDVGNAASTLTSDFTVKKSPAAFTVKDPTKNYDGFDFLLSDNTKDQVKLSFTSPVRFTGNVDNALNLSNYTLNGNKLPDGSIAKLDLTSGSDKAGYKTVIITLPDGTLKQTTENTLNISKSLLSAGGIQISGLTEISELALGALTPVEQQLQQEISESNTLVNNAAAGDQPGQYPAAAIAEFKAAIEAAQAILNNPNSTDAQAATAKTNLEAAQAKFAASKIGEAQLGEIVITSADYQANDAAIGLGLIPHRIMGTVAEEGVTEVKIKLDGDSDIAGGQTYTAPVTNGKFDYTVAVDNSGNFTTAQASYTKNGTTVASDTVTIVSLSKVAPKVSNVSVSTAAGEKVTATVTDNTITFDGVKEEAAYTTGTVTVSEDVTVTGLSKEKEVDRTDDFVSILEALFDANVDGSVKGSVLLSLDGETLTLTDIDGSKTVYTLVVK